MYSCLQFEESLISHKMAQLGDESEDETPDTEEDDGKGFLLSDDGKDIDLRCNSILNPFPYCCQVAITHSIIPGSSLNCVNVQSSTPYVCEMQKRAPKHQDSNGSSVLHKQHS